MIGVLMSKLESFREKHDALSRAYALALKELHELRLACLRKEADADRARNSTLNELHWTSEENALLRLQSLEYWEQVCMLTGRLEQLTENLRHHRLNPKDPRNT